MAILGAKRMITAILAFIHARHLLVWLVATAIVVTGIAYWHHATFKAEMERVRAEDRAALAKAQQKADLETSRLKGIADAAEKVRNEEHDQLVAYRTAQPLHGQLCTQPRNSLASVPAIADTVILHAGPSAATANLQPVPTGDSAASGRADPDVRHLLDVFAGRADEVSATLREFQSR